MDVAQLNMMTITGGHRKSRQWPISVLLFINEY